MEFSIKSADPPTHQPTFPSRGTKESQQGRVKWRPPLPLVRSETGDGWCHNNEKNKKNNTYQNLLEGRVLKVWNCAKLNSA